MTADEARSIALAHGVESLMLEEVRREIEKNARQGHLSLRFYATYACLTEIDIAFLNRDGFQVKVDSTGSWYDISW